MDSNNQVASSSENKQTNLCYGSLSTDFDNMTMEMESFRSDIKWNPIFDEKIFLECWLWFKVKYEHAEL